VLTEQCDKQNVSQIIKKNIYIKILTPLLNIELTTSSAIFPSRSICLICGATVSAAIFATVKAKRDTFSAISNIVSTGIATALL